MRRSGITTSQWLPRPTRSWLPCMTHCCPRRGPSVTTSTGLSLSVWRSDTMRSLTNHVYMANVWRYFTASVRTPLGSHTSDTDSRRLCMLPPLKPDSILRARYRIVEIVGQGGMGSIYRAEDIRLTGRFCAIKEVQVDPSMSDADQEQSREQFYREATILARL